MSTPDRRLFQPRPRRLAKGWQVRRSSRRFCSSTGRTQTGCDESGTPRTCDNGFQDRGSLPLDGITRLSYLGSARQDVASPRKPLLQGRDLNPRPPGYEYAFPHTNPAFWVALDAPRPARFHPPAERKCCPVSTTTKPFGCQMAARRWLTIHATPDRPDPFA
jgi:hypothetical protein